VRHAASSVRLGVLLGSDPSEDVRRSAWDALRSVEPHVLDHGFVELVRMRNRLGRMLGADDYYDWKVRRVEGLTKRRSSRSSTTSRCARATVRAQRWTAWRASAAATRRGPGTCASTSAAT
jgi:hypothetical protein